MFISGTKAKEELATLSRVVGSNSKIKVTFTGGDIEASSGVDEIYLPDIPANAEIDNRKMRELRGLADHESFHCRYTPLDEWAKIARYVNACKDPMSMGILNGAEDVRIERLGMKEFPGTRRNIQTTVNRATELQRGHAQEAGTDQWVGYFSLVLTWIGRVDNGMAVPLSKELEEVVSKFAGFDLAEMYKPDTFAGLLEAVADNLNDNWKVSTLRDYLDGKPPKTQEEKKKEQQQQQQQSGEGDEKKQDEKKGQSPAEPDKKEQPKPKAGDAAKAQEANQSGKPLPSIHLSQIAKDINCDLPYFGDEDQIDYERAEPYLGLDNQPMNWVDTYGLGEGLVQALKDKITKRNAAGRRQALLDNKKLVGAYNRQENIWRNKKELERGYNTAVSFVVDWSSSMHTNSRAMLAITSSLARGISQVGIPLEITGFTEDHGIGRAKDHCVRSGALRIYSAKGFDEPLDHRRVAGLVEMLMGFTPDTEALALAVQRIDKRIEARKVVIILTDGGSQPANRRTITYKGKRIDNIHGIYNKHRISVLEQAEKDGIEVYAIALGQHDVNGYDPKRVLRVQNMSELEARIFRLFFDVISRKGH